MAKNKIFTFAIPDKIVHEIFAKQQEGNNEIFKEETDTLQGSERGGHFCFRMNKTKSTVTVTGFKEVKPPPGTSLNSGDNLFTFHTHPVVLKWADGEKTPVVDNYPNIMSGDDLFGCVLDNHAYQGDKTTRKICKDTKSQRNVSGVNFFDIVAAPCGMYVYSPDLNSKLMKTKKKSVEKLGKDLENYTKELFTEYSYKRRSYYSKMTNVMKGQIQEYIKTLSDHGFIVYFFPWEAALKHGIQFPLPFDSDFVDKLKSKCNC